MARILFNDIAIIKGSIGGTTFFKGQQPGIVARSKVASVNPRTSLQTVSRAAFSGAAQLWKNLSDVERANWEAYALTVTYPDDIGAYENSGRAVMMGIMQFALWSDARLSNMGDLDADPPLLPGWLLISQVLAVAPVTAGITGIALSVTSDNTEPIEVVVERTRAFDASRLTYRGRVRADLVAATSFAGPASNLTEFDGLVTGAVYFTRVRAITLDAPHRITQEFWTRHVAVDIAP